MTAQETADKIWNDMKGFRITNAHRKKCCLKYIDGLIESHELTVKEFRDKAKYWKEVQKEHEYSGGFHDSARLVLDLIAFYKQVKLILNSK